MSSILDQILASRRVEVARLYSEVGLDAMIAAAEGRMDPIRDFRGAIRRSGLSLIAEIKRKSPSKGIIRERFDPVALGIEFEAAGASALSILTEPDHFDGDLAFISEVKAQVSLPALRKDFIVDPIQIYEAKAVGADAILLIRAILSDDECEVLLALATRLGLSVVFEVHSVAEWVKISPLVNLRIVGVNNRDLRSFEVDLNTVFDVQSAIQHDRSDLIIVAESGYTTPEEMVTLADRGIDAVLIGEGLAKFPPLLNHFKMAPHED